MQRIKILLCFCLISLLFMCKTPHALPIDENEEKIFFGAGGGFSGIPIEYCLMLDGRLFTKDYLKNEWIQIVNVNKKKIRTFIKSLDKQLLLNYNLNQPGNRYKFLNYQKEGRTYTITWGKEGFNPPQEIIDIYTSLNALRKND